MSLAFGHDGQQEGSIMIRKLIAALILVPLAVVFATFAVANRQTIVV